jgi:hypothetical protein
MNGISVSNRVCGAFAFELCCPLSLVSLPGSSSVGTSKNERVVASMRMGWDMGPPMWPYRAVQILSYSMNVPAYLVSWPILKLLEPRAYSFQYAVRFPAILALWWWVGRTIDFGLLGNRRYAHRKLIAASLLIGALALLSLATYVGQNEYHWAHQYWSGHPLVDAFLFLRSAGEMLWCIFLAAAFVRSAARLVKGQSSSDTGMLPSTVKMSVGNRDTRRPMG